jgi:hypothetical protein
MAFSDGAVVEGLFADEGENFIGARARLKQSSLKVVTYADCGRSSHVISPSVGCGFREKDASKNKNARRLSYARMVTLWR